MSTVFATTGTIRRDDEIYSADDARSFITLQSMLILLALISFVLLCLCGCVLLGRNTNTLFTYKNDYITNSRYHSHSRNESHGTEATTTAAAAAAATTNSNNTNTNTNTDVASPNTLVMHSSISLSEYEMIELSSKCFGTVVVRTATTSKGTLLSQPQQQQHDGDDLTNQVMHHSIMQAEFHGNDIIDLSNTSQTASLEVANHPDHQYLHQNACCIICLVDYVHGDSIYRNHPNCLHIFHTRCIQQWVQQQQQQHSQSQAPVAATSSPQHSGNISSECPCCRCPIHPILRSNPNSK